MARSGAYYTLGYGVVVLSPESRHMTTRETPWLPLCLHAYSRIWHYDLTFYDILDRSLGTYRNRLRTCSSHRMIRLHTTSVLYGVPSCE